MTSGIDRLVGGGNLAVLDRLIRFTEARHRLLADNIANIDTPGYKMRDLAVGNFQHDLQAAIDGRSLAAGASTESAGQVDFNQYLLFHDRNNRSIEKQITAMTENAMLHNVAVELLRSRYGLLEKAIALRP